MGNRSHPVPIDLSDTTIAALGGASAGAGDTVKVTPVLTTVAHTAGDVLFDTTAVPDAVKANGGLALLQSVTLIDKDDQGAALDLFVVDTNVALGTANVAPTITDANAEQLRHVGSIAAADWQDVGGARIATLRGIGLQVEAAADSRAIYVAAITRGTPTHAVAGLVVKLDLLWG